MVYQTRKPVHNRDRGTFCHPSKHVHRLRKDLVTDITVIPQAARKVAQISDFRRQATKEPTGVSGVRYILSLVATVLLYDYR